MLYKDVKIESNVENYQGLTFSHIVATIDFDKLAQTQSQQPGCRRGREVDVRW